jgi:hypothetical protein
MKTHRQGQGRLVGPLTLLLALSLTSCPARETATTTGAKLIGLLDSLHRPMSPARQVYLVNFTAKCDGCVQSMASYYKKNTQNPSLTYIICPQSLRDLKVEYPHAVRVSRGFVVDTASVALSLGLVSDKPGIFLCWQGKLVSHWELEFGNRDSTYRVIDRFTSGQH